MWNFLTEAYKHGGIQAVIALASLAANYTQWRWATTRQRKMDEIMNTRVDEAKATVDRVLAVKHEFDQLAEKLQAVVEAVVEARASRDPKPGRRSDR